VGVGDDIVGRPVNAVLAPPQAERFAAAAGVDLNQLVLLDLDRVFLFPRSAIGVEWPALPGSLMSWSTATFTKISCLRTVTG
jgi:hypothetical protein